MSSRKIRVRPFSAILRTGTPGTVLARIYRTVLHDLGVTAERYHALMLRYIAKSVMYANRNEKASTRASLSSELLKESMTWKTFILGLKFLNMDEYTLAVELTRPDGVSRATVTSTLNQHEPNDTPQGEHLATLVTQLMTCIESQEHYHELMDRYMSKNYSKIETEKRGAIRSSFNKESSKPVITWKTFMKVLVFLEGTKIVFRLTLKHPTHRVTAHETVVLIDGMTINEENDED